MISKIENWLNIMRVKNYIINENLSIDVNSSLNLVSKNIKFFPDFIQFRNIKGYFNCSHNELISLRGFPKNIGNYFICSHNNLKSLKGGPEIVEGNLDCTNNPLESLEGFPKKVGGYLVSDKGLFSPLRIRNICEVQGKIYEYSLNS